jgi:hypothetical protein
MPQGKAKTHILNLEQLTKKYDADKAEQSAALIKEL